MAGAKLEIIISGRKTGFLCTSIGSIMILSLLHGALILRIIMLGMMMSMSAITTVSGEELMELNLTSDEQEGVGIIEQSAHIFWGSDKNENYGFVDQLECVSTEQECAKRLLLIVHSFSPKFVGESEEQDVSTFKLQSIRNAELVMDVWHDDDLVSFIVRTIDSWREEDLLSYEIFLQDVQDINATLVGVYDAEDGNCLLTQCGNAKQSNSSTIRFSRPKAGAGLVHYDRSSSWNEGFVANLNTTNDFLNETIQIRY